MCLLIYKLWQLIAPVTKGDSVVVNMIWYGLTLYLCPLPHAEGEVGEKDSPPTEQDELLLDNWIKELESGIKSMAEIAGAPAEVSQMDVLYNSSQC